MQEDGTTGTEVFGWWSEEERHWRALWADRFGLDGKFHNAGTERWPDESDKKKDQKGK